MTYKKKELFTPETTQSLASHYKEILKLLGEDTSREGILKTPERVAKSMQFLTHGYQLDPVAILKSAMFKEEYQQMVLVKDIELYSMCEHHMLPFYGKCHVAYIPNGYITGLSKIPRVVDAFARRLQVQERASGGCRGHRGRAHVHADSRSTKAELGNHHISLYGSFPQQPQDKRRVPQAHRSRFALKELTVVKHRAGEYENFDLRR